MQSHALRACALLLLTTPCARALAHGEPPTASAVLSHDAQGLRALRLSAGVALRQTEQRYQFVCPAAWGDQFPASLAALSDGTLVVGATRGLMLLHADGMLLPHPDPAALGHSSDVVRSAHGVFAVRTTAEGSELLAVDAQKVRVLWKDPKVLYSLAALDDNLVLLRGEGALLEQVTLAPSGEELERQQAQLELPLDYAFARAAEGQPYALVVLRNGSVRLGALRMNTFAPLAQGLTSIAGPLRVAEGTMLAIDGALVQLLDGATTPLPGDRNVHCLDRREQLAYACDHEGMSRVTGLGLGEPLFRWRWLIAPNLAQVADEEARLRCSAQWEDLRADLRLAGTTLAEDTTTDAGTPQDAEADGAEPAADSRDAAFDAQETEGEPKRSRRARATSCNALPGKHSPDTAFVHAYSIVLGLVLFLARRQRIVDQFCNAGGTVQLPVLRSGETRSASESQHAPHPPSNPARRRA